MTRSLPPGWALTTLGEVVDPVPLTGLKLPQGQYEATGSLPVVDQGQKLVGGYTNREDLRIRVARPVIVFGDHTKAIKYVDFDFVAGADGIKPLVTWEVYFPKLFYYFLHALRLPDKGYARHFQFLAKSLLPLPPLPEQRRIVAKIEELFSQLDAGVEELKKAKAQLKRYRHSVLKAAFEGKLTEEWRKQNLTTKTPRHKEGKKPETAQELLDRIREERKKALGAKYKEPPPLDTSDLPELPEGWAWARLDALAANEPHAITDGPFGSNLKTSHYTDSGPRVIRLQNVGEGTFVDAMAHISREHFMDLARHEVLTGDLVVAALGENLPRSCIIPSSVGPAIVKADCIRFKPSGSATSARFLNIVLNAEPLKKMVSDTIHGVGRPRLNQQQVKALPVPLPPVAEQKTIVLEVEERLSIADAQEKTIEAALKQATRLRQSILKRAFDGRLVPQDPSDEPADRLLERIRAEKAKREAGQSRGRGCRIATARK